MKKLTLFTIFLMLVFSSLAWADIGKNEFRFGVQYVSPTGGLTDEQMGETLEVDNTTGISLGFERVLISRLGVDFNLCYSKHDLELSAPALTENVGDINMFMPVTAGLNYHIVRNRLVDFYVGPFAGYVFYGDIDPAESGMTTVSIENDFAIGGVLGLDISATGKGWMFTSALKYLQTTAKPELPSWNELDVDPWVIQFGFGYRF